MPTQDVSDPIPDTSATRSIDAHLPLAHSAEQAFQEAANQYRHIGLRRFIPNSIDNAVREYKACELRQVGDARKRSLSMGLEAKLQAIEEELNETLSKGKAALRVDAELFIQGQFDRLITGLNQRMEDFQADLDRRYERLETIKFPRIREQEEQRIAKDYERYCGWVEHKIDEFRAAMADRVRR